MRPDRHGNVDEQEPEGDERHKVVELVRTIHDEAQNDDKEIHSEHHLGNDKMTNSIQSLLHLKYEQIFMFFTTYK